MAFNVVSDILAYSRHDGTELLVALVIAEAADRDSREAFLKVDTIATRARRSTRQVQRALRALGRSGEVDVVANSKGGRRCATYRVVVGGDKGGVTRSMNGSEDGSGVASVTPGQTPSRHRRGDKPGRLRVVGDGDTSSAAGYNEAYRQ